MSIGNMDNSVITMGFYNKVDISKNENLKKLKQSCNDFESEILKFYLKSYSDTLPLNIP